MDKKTLRRFIGRNIIWSAVVISALVSAVVGGTVGFYVVASNPQIIGAAPAIFRNITSSNNTDNSSASKIIDPETQVIATVKSASPAVVSVVASKDLAVVQQQGINPFQNFCDDPFFRQFLGDQCAASTPTPAPKTQKQQVAAGSGFLISPDGLILTNKHVVNIDGASYTVLTSDGKTHSAKVLARDPVQDVALLKIDGVNLPYLTLADSSTISIGQTVIAIGNALGQFSNTVSKGVVSGLGRSIVASDNGSSSEKLDAVIQTDAAINPGNSGGPLLNLAGQVIGINTAIVQGAQNIGFAIPINQAKRDIAQVKTIGKISYPFLGIRYVIVNDTVKQQKNLSVNYGALITRGQNASDVAITPGSPAEIAGIKENDIVLEINGKKITTDNDLAKILQNFNVGNTVKLKILSDGKEKIVSVVLGERK